MNIVLLVLCIWFFLALCVNENKNTELNKENKELKIREFALKELIKLHEKRINDLERGIKINRADVSEDLKRAVKFAMIQAHPDKGNTKNADDFIKFKELYDKLK